MTSSLKMGKRRHDCRKTSYQGSCHSQAIIGSTKIGEKEGII